MPSKMSIYMSARSIAAYYVGEQKGKVRDWELLKEIYDVMEPKRNWNEAELKAIQTGKWLRKDGIPGGTTDEKFGVSWCGMFAVYVLRSVGLPIIWKGFQGIAPLEPFLEIKSYAYANEIEPGDICVRGTNQHHFIVRHREGDRLYSIDGNLPGQSIGHRDYGIKETVEAARKADISMAQKQKDLSPADFQKHVRDTSKYNFYFYRLKKS